MNQNQHGKPGPKEMAVVEALRTRFMPTLYNIENLMREMSHNPTAPPEWTDLMRHHTLITNQINTIFTYINGPDQPTLSGPESHTQDLASLHPYPIPPFPLEQPPMAGLASTLLRKKLEPSSEDWINQRLAKAREFCNVPPEWDVPDLKAKDAAAGDDEDDEGAEVKRKVGSLDEDELAELWSAAAGVANERVQRFVAMYKQEAEEGDDEDEDEDEEMEDVIGGEQKGDGAAAAAAAAAKLPIMPLGAVHKFMSTGMVERPVGA
ncbi:hypothetical protein BS50DRAFT_576949 [Corynespora cassiicola Philippines]|uniref:Uncharacterized protein n=1 Tax=Corynespora cassiicola Philippines TaxID=1448308 RepID=A0A2T2NCK0_CORCC|nr:hypothetical protein BS50DRAFT_576949 [Corynespora cassiicola Philippines]